MRFSEISLIKLQSTLPIFLSNFLGALHCLVTFDIKKFPSKSLGIFKAYQGGMFALPDKIKLRRTEVFLTAKHFKPIFSKNARAID